MNKLTKQTGFTFAEIVIATMILVVIFTGVMVTFIKCVELNELSSNSSVATAAARNKLMEIENTLFNQVNANYDNVPFVINNLNGMGVTYIDDSTPGILTITASVSWRQRNGRTIGEDADLDGQLDTGEDANGNGQLNSIITFSTQRFDT